MVHDGNICHLLGLFQRCFHCHRAGLTFLLLLFCPRAHAASVDKNYNPEVHSEFNASPDPPEDQNQLPEIRRSWNPDVGEIGYRLGYIDRVSITGGVRQIFFKTLTGEVLLGVSSSKGVLVDEVCMAAFTDRLSKVKTPAERITLMAQAQRQCQMTISPWEFSSYNTSEEFAQSLRDGMTLIYYARYHFLPLTLTDSIVFSAHHVDPNRAIATYSMDVSDELPVARNVHYSRGYINGRIVRAALEGTVFPVTYEVTLQIGSAGNIFMRMSLSVTKLFNFIVQAMATGRLLRIYYFKLYGLQGWAEGVFPGYETYYRIYRVDVLNETAPPSSRGGGPAGTSPENRPSEPSGTPPGSGEPPAPPPNGAPSGTPNKTPGPGGE